MKQMQKMQNSCRTFCLHQEPRIMADNGSILSLLRGTWSDAELQSPHAGAWARARARNRLHLLHLAIWGVSHQSKTGAFQMQKMTLQLFCICLQLRPF